MGNIFAVVIPALEFFIFGLPNYLYLYSKVYKILNFGGLEDRFFD